METAPKYQKGLTFEDVWAMFQETDRRFKEADRRFEKSKEETDLMFQKRREEIELMFQKRREETDLLFQKRREETDRLMKESKDDFNIRIGSLTNLFGDFTLGMVVPKLREKFEEQGLIFIKANQYVEVNDKKNDISFEIDIMLENGDKAMLVEVKTKLTEERINKHTIRLEKMRRYADLHGDKRIFLGAVAGFAIADEVKMKALREGFYVIEPDGENFNIIPPNDKPKEW